MNDPEESRQYPSDKSKDLYQGIRKDPELYKYIRDCYNRSADYIKSRKIFEKSQRYSKMYENGDAWAATGTTRAGHLSKVKISIAFEAIETSLTLVTSRVPKPDIQPRFDQKYQPYIQAKELMRQAHESQDEQLAEQANNIYEQMKSEMSEYTAKMQRQMIEDWHDWEMPNKLRMLTRDKFKIGNAFIKSEYIPGDKEKIENTICDSTTIYPSPNCDTIESHKFEPFIYAPILSVKEVEEKYGIPSDAIKESALGVFAELKQYQTTTSGFSAKVMAWGKSFFERGKSGKHVIILECYMPANMEEEIEEYERDDYERNDTGELRYDENNKTIPIKIPDQRPLFPSGYKRVTIILGHSNWIVEEIDNPYKLPPFFEMKNFAQAGDFYGISDIQNIEDMIMRIDRNSSDVYDSARLTGNPILILPQDATKETDPDTDQASQGIKSHPGAIYKTTMTEAPRFLQPPTSSYDWKWLLDYWKGWIDRITHLSDSIRGFNEFSGDSGKKVRELRIAAMGSFQTKLDEQAEFLTKLYKHWAWIYQNQYQGTIVQKVEDDFGDAQFEEFIPNQGKDLDLIIRVSAISLLPRDVYGEWEEAQYLYGSTLDDGRTRMISPEQLIDTAPTIEDKTRIKRYIAKKQEEISQNMQREQSMMEFVNITKQISGGTVQDPDQLAQMIQRMVGIASQFPEVIKTQEYQNLPMDYKLGISKVISGMGGFNGGQQQ